MGTTMGMRTFGVSSLTMLLLLPILGAIFSSPILMPVQAADACQGDTQAIQWNETMQRISEVPHWSDSSYSYYDEGYDSTGESSVNSEGSSSSEGTPDAQEVPEEPWMYQQNTYQWNLPVLEPLTTSHYTTMLIGNNSVGSLRLNLSALHRTTICVTLQDTDSNPIEGDVYLLTSSEYDSYSSSYQCAQTSAWYCLGDGEVEEALSDIPPEWRSWNPLGWKSYRDAHEYERVSSVNFALNLDRPEVYSPLWGGSDWEDFYIVVDAWDNIHDNDAEAPGVTIAADVTIITTERSLILPSYTVALAFMAMLLGALAAPFLLNAKYMKAGLAPKQTTDGLVPSLELPAELPQFTSHEPPIGESMPVPPQLMPAAAEPALNLSQPGMAQPVEDQQMVEATKAYDVSPFDV